MSFLLGKIFLYAQVSIKNFSPSKMVGCITETSMLIMSKPIMVRLLANENAVTKRNVIVKKSFKKPPPLIDWFIAFNFNVASMAVTM